MNVKRVFAMLCVSAAMLGGCEDEEEGANKQPDAGTTSTDGETPLPDSAALLAGADAGADDDGPSVVTPSASAGRIVIFSERGGSWVVYRDDGDKREALNESTDNNVFVSPDGTKLLTGAGGTKIVRASDRMVTSMIPGTIPGGWLTNDRLLVSNLQGAFRRNLKIVDIDGGNETILSDKGSNPADPPLSSDGKKVLWVDVDGASTWVRTADLDGSNAKTFKPRTGHALVSWSRDGRVAYTTTVSGDGKLYVLSGELEGDRAVADALTGIKGIRPWHPASHVLVASETTGQGGARIAKFYDVDLDSGEAVEQPAWDAAGTMVERIHLSADGTKALFSAGNDVKVADRDGANAVTIGSGYGSTQMARW